MNKEFIKRLFSSIILVPVSLFFIVKGSFFFNFFISICFIITVSEWHIMSKKKSYYLIGFVFLFFSFYTVYYLRNYDGNNYTIFLLVLITCVATDIGGYIFGKVFRGPKLTKISPNKTYTGMFGSFILPVIFTSLFLNNKDYLGFGTNIEIPLNFFFIVLLTSLVSQVGDLIISNFKRRSKIKNTGKIIPGHGGLLDRIDGMIFAFPFIFILIKIFE